jgi:hypothetical protein
LVGGAQSSYTIGRHGSPEVEFSTLARRKGLIFPIDNIILVGATAHDNGLTPLDFRACDIDDRMRDWRKKGHHASYGSNEQ